MTRKANATSFKKGQSGNPGGRPKEVGDVREMARERTKEAIGTLEQVMRNTDAPPSARVAAATAILDRGWGKPQQSVDVTHRREIADLSDADLLAIANLAAASSAGTAEAEDGEGPTGPVH